MSYDGNKIKWIGWDPDLDYSEVEKNMYKRMSEITGISPNYLGHDKENIGSITICGTAGDLNGNSFSEMWKNLSNEPYKSKNNL